jgi:adenosylcobinamide kinase/adenosylcobinamide-phosphate guanylyltransferase
LYLSPAKNVNPGSRLGLAQSPCYNDSMNPQVTLILGGARSGKSRFALRQNSPTASSVEHYFIATAMARDNEMKIRIEKHQKDRPSTWKTQEEPYDLLKLLQKTAHQDQSLVVVDCLTLWLSNLLCGMGGPTLSPEAIEEKIDELQKEIPRLNGRVIFVSNEVGLGLVPQTSLGRDFRDLQGKLNQSIAEVSSDIFFLVAGIAQKIK